MTPAVELRDVYKRYGTDLSVEVLHGVDVRIDEGELVSIVGPSGSGKTTLLHIMGALQRPSSGSVLIARALVRRPALILADEPTGDLDSRTGKTILAPLTELGEQGITIAIVTHDREIAAATPRMIEIRDGRITRDQATLAVRGHA